MTLERLDIDPYYNDPVAGHHSLRNLAELMIPCLDAVGARSVIEVGAYAGDLTGCWPSGRGDRRAGVGRGPSLSPSSWSSPSERPELELIRETSLEALPRIPMPDVVIIDGDHNYYTVSEELRLIGERAPGASCRCCSSTTCAGRTGAATTTSRPT